MRIFTTVFIIGLLLARCSDPGRWKCKGDCLDGYGVKEWPDGGYMKGNWKHGALIGEGIQFFGNSTKFAGDTYIGSFKNGYNGYGTYYGKILDFVHKGYWTNGKPSGYGESIFGPNSSNPNWSYKGEWKDGKKSGYGILFAGTIGRHAGIKYIGQWLNDDMDGLGKYYWPDGSIYDGHFANDLFDGKATFIFKDGYRFIGNWHRGDDSDFEKTLPWHSKHVKDRDSILNKFFSE